MPVDKAKTYIPQGARPPINPHHHTGLDHSVWMDVGSGYDFTRSHYGSGSGAGALNGNGSSSTSPAPLTRARSAQEILASPSPKRYYYEDYADSPSTPSAGSTSTSSRALHLSPPGPAAASSSYTSSPSPIQYTGNYTNTYTSGAQPTEEPTVAAANTNMRYSFPSPSVPDFTSNSRSSPTPPSSYSPTGRKGHGLVLPRKPSHRSTLSQERGEFALPYNNSETSFDAAGVLADVSACLLTRLVAMLMYWKVAYPFCFVVV